MQDEGELERCEVRYIPTTYRSYVWCTGCRRTFERDEVAGARHAAAARHIVRIRRVGENFVGPIWDLEDLLFPRHTPKAGS